MGFRIKNVASGAIFEVTSAPVLHNGVWECGNQRFTDPSGAAYRPVGDDVVVDVPTFFMLITPQEEVAIRASTDPVVKVWLARLDDPRTTAVNLSLPSISQGLGYLTTVTYTLPDGDPAPLLAPGRVPQILAAQYPG